MSKACDKARRLKKRHKKYNNLMEKYTQGDAFKWDELGKAIAEDMMLTMCEYSPSRYLMGLETKEEYLMECQNRRAQLQEWKRTGIIKL